MQGREVRCAAADAPVLGWQGNAGEQLVGAAARPSVPGLAQHVGADDLAEAVGGPAGASWCGEEGDLAAAPLARLQDMESHLDEQRVAEAGQWPWGGGVEVAWKAVQASGLPFGYGGEDPQPSE